MNVTPTSFLQRHWHLLILIALVGRGLYVLLQLHEVRGEVDLHSLYVERGDSKDYLEPVEHWIAQGSYSPDHRMPGLGVPYAVLRQFLDPEASRNALILLQWILSSIGVYLLAVLAWRMSGSTRIGIVVYVAFLLSAFSSWYDTSLSSDSLATSTLILLPYILQSAVDRRDPRLVLLAGFILTWCIFLRPIAVLLIIPAGWLLHHSWDRGKATRMALLFALPFLLVDGAWALRNWHVHGKLAPLTNEGIFSTRFTAGVHYHAMRFVQGYGGSYIWWNPGADIRWFGIWKGGGPLDDEGRSAPPPPPFAYAGTYTPDSLSLLAQRIRALDDPFAPTHPPGAQHGIIATFDRYTAQYEADAPWNYHLLSRLRMLRNILWQHGTESMIFRPFDSLPWWTKAFKLLQSLFYVLAYSIGPLAAVLLLWKWRRATTLLAIWIPMVLIYNTLIYPIGLRMCEWRYLSHAFPFALLLAVLFVMNRRVHRP